MALLKDIKSTNWQVSILGSGNVEEGLQDVRQCLDVLLRTQKGTDPLRSEFGSDIYQQLDKPINAVIPNIKRAIISAVALFEKRVEIVSISHVLDVSNIQFFITYKIIDNDLIDQLQLYVSGAGFIVAPARIGRLIIEGVIPANGSFQLLLSFISDGNIALPIPPVMGFANASIMYAWVQVNWGFYGQWFLLPGKLVLFMNPGIAQSASLTITTSVMYRYTSAIPALAPGQIYQLYFINELPAFGIYYDAGSAISSLLNLAIQQFGNYGRWVIESYDGRGDFDILDFATPDFFTGRSYQLALYTPTLNNASLIVSVA